MSARTLAATSFDHLLVDEAEPGIFVVTLNRPERLNALHPALFDDLHKLCTVVEGDPGVRVLVLTGAGRGFCAGADLQTINEVPTTGVTDFLAAQEHGARVVARLKRLPVPVVAAVNGPAAGGGLALALASDIRVAAQTAVFTVAFVRLGLSGCDVGVSWLLPRVVGLGEASLLMLTGRRIDADEAARIGLVTSVVAGDELIPTALDLARELVGNSPLALKLTKEGLELNVDAPSLDAAIALENRNQVLASRSEDAAIAMSAFAAGERPRFTGR